jgi:23S rRNA (cytosine1962-C5)-methyltransferase
MAAALGRPPRVLNLFAHTGLATLAAARAGAAVAHVDAARAAVGWARRNAELSGLADREIRWLVDDALAFTEREARRGRRYDGLILDPPSAGHGGSGHGGSRRTDAGDAGRGGAGRGGAGRWTLRDDLPGLLEACARVTAEDAFVLLTAHSSGLTGEALAAPLLRAFRRGGSEAEVVRLSLAAASGAILHLGWAVRLGSAVRLGGSPARNAAP